MSLQCKLVMAQRVLQELCWKITRHCFNLLVDSEQEVSFLRNSSLLEPAFNISPEILDLVKLRSATYCYKARNLIVKSFLKVSTYVLWSLVKNEYVLSEIAFLPKIIKNPLYKLNNYYNILYLCIKLIFIIVLII